MKDLLFSGIFYSYIKFYELSPATLFSEPIIFIFSFLLP